jgi:hypothetical protein
MSRKTLIYIGAFIGSSLGGYVPVIWGASLFSGWSILLSGVGGLAGIWLAVKVT